MPRRVVLRPQARADREHEVRYHRRRAGVAVAQALTAALDGALVLIQRQPGIGSPRLAHALNLPGLLVWRVTGIPLAWCYFERADHLDVVRLLGERQGAWAQLAGTMAG